jgi:hypothetical protein
MDWLDNIKKELELSKNHPIRKKKDWEIERDIRLIEISKKGGKITGKINGKIAGRTAVESGQLASVRSLGGKNGGRKAVESGFLKSIASQGGKVGGKIGGKTTCAKVHICPHCKKPYKGPTYFRWHGDKCKQNPTLFLNI